MIPTLKHRLAQRDRPLGFPVMHQHWSRLLFLHWPLSSDLIQATLPKGLHVDTFQGQAWIGIVPFYMERVRPVLFPSIPGISWFLELNVRTYVHDERGDAGVWFYSLDCNQPLAVEVARRWFHLNYHHACMSAKTEGDWVHYYCQRKGEAEASKYCYRPASDVRVAEPGSFEFFLVERYLLFSADRDGCIRSGRVYHTPYTFADAECQAWSAAPIRQAGLPLPSEAPASQLYAPGVDVQVYPLR